MKNNNPPHTLATGSRRMATILDAFVDELGKEMTQEGEFGDIPKHQRVDFHMSFSVKIVPLNLGEWFSMTGYRLYRPAAA